MVTSPIKWLLGIVFIAILLSVSCADMDPPRIVETETLGSTVDYLGPYEVTTLVEDDREIRVVYLYYGEGDAKTPEGNLARTKMSDNGEGRYTGSIPGFATGSHIIYFISAVDEEGNIGRDPETGYFAFDITK